MLFFSRKFCRNWSKVNLPTKRVSMSVAISYNIPGKEEAACFISEGEEGDLVKKMLDCLEELPDRFTKIYVKNTKLLVLVISIFEVLE